MIFSEGSRGRQKPKGQPFKKPYQLYNLESDPQEKLNVLEKNDEIALEIEGILNDIMISTYSKEIGLDN
ncbi:MAG: hypothetical protein JXR07_00295 [Reichenbachiella sp.]